MKIHLDFETRSELDIKRVGAWAYAAHPSTDITCMCWAVDDNPVGRYSGLQHGPRDWWRTPGSFRVGAHSAQFEYAVYHFILHRRYGWPAMLDPKLWDCTMARAYACGLPGSLAGVAMALRVPMQKDLEGQRAMFATCRPKGYTSEGRPIWNEDPATLAELYRYCGKDVETERAVDHALPELTPSERRVFEHDLVMNRRGVAIDVRTARQAVAIAGELTTSLNARLRELTGNAVDKATQLPSLKRWIAAQGVEVPTVEKITTDDEGVSTIEEKETLDKEAVGRLTADPAVPQIVKDVLVVRSQVGKSSVAKYQKMLDVVCADWRARGTQQYHGAHTGRSAGRLLQPLNFPQGLVGAEQEQAILLLSEPSLFIATYGDRAMQTLSDCLRGMIVPAEGKVFIGADYNAIEARFVFWFAGEQRPLDGYARGESPYLDMARDIYGREISKKDTPVEYDIGKRTVLGCGFGMGWKRFKETVRTQTAAKGTPVEVSDELAQRAVATYRDKYSRVVSLWYETQAAAIAAVQNPGHVGVCAGERIYYKMSRDGLFLMCRLPSGRLLRYFRPHVKAEETAKGERDVLYYWTAADERAIKTECNGMLGLYRTWGGELVENYVQASARDVMVEGMLAAEAAGYQMVMTVYDELLAEVPDPAFSSVLLGQSESVVRHFEKLMCPDLVWNKGCPLAAEGWIGRRYRK